MDYLTENISEDISEDAKLAVKRGIYWLDENHHGWAERIDLGQLDMAECEQCVIGQAVGAYSQTTADAAGTLRASMESATWAVEHGFESPVVAIYMNTQSGPITYGYTELDVLWAEEVEKRLS